MTLSQPQSAPDQKGPLAYKWKVLMTVVFGIFMIILDTTVVNVAFQTLRQEFNASLNDSQWIISIYVLAIGISTPLAGFAADRFGVKKTYLGALSVFVIGSFLCGIAPNLWFMVAARAFQGLGGGLAMPLGLALLLGSFPVREQGTALGLFGIATLVAPALGPIMGGWLVDHNLWRFIFFINPPIGLVGVILGSFLLQERKSERRPRLDIWGLVTEVVGFGSILYAASIAANEGWTSPDVVVWFVVGVVGLVLFAVVELFVAREPLLDLRLFKKRIFLNATVLGYVSVIALFGAEFLMPVYLQSLRGRSAFDTGLILLPMAVTGGLATIFSGRLYDRVGPRPLVAAGFAILIVNTWQLSLLRGDTAIPWILFLLALRGLALGLTMQPTLVTALSVVPMPAMARGSSLSNATRNVVQSIGVALLATVLASTLSPQVQVLEAQFSEAPGPATAPRIALCDPNVGVASVISTGGAMVLGQDAITTIQRACTENVAGFERAYGVTFFAAVIALAMGLMLPGWPFKWAGRRAADVPAAGH